MRIVIGLFLILILTGCQATNSATNVTILDGSQMINIQTEANSPAVILMQSGLAVHPQDRVELRGADLPLDFRLPDGGSFTLQILRSHTITILKPEGQTILQTNADNVGLALAQAGVELYAGDFIIPPLETPILSDLSVTYRPARIITINVDGASAAIKSSQVTVGQALAAASYGLSGLDKSEPAEFEPIPADGQVRIIRVRETVTLVQKTVPFTKKYVYSTSQAVGEIKVIQAGEPGLIISRVRTRYEDGVPVKKTTEAESTVKLPKESIISLSSQVQAQTLDIPGGQVEYWRAVQMYATSYSPCNSGTPKCSYGTASGLPVKQGVVALVPSLYNQLAGTRVYIPGYGIGVVGDVGGGFPDGRLWIDLGYSDNDYQSWAGEVTVYFLTPAPASIPAGLN